jgi:hypothetical protein
MVVDVKMTKPLHIDIKVVPYRIGDDFWINSNFAHQRGIRSTQHLEPNPTGSYHTKVRVLKCSIGERALVDADGNHAEAARSLDVSPSYFCRLARDLQVRLTEP